MLEGHNHLNVKEFKYLNEDEVQYLIDVPVMISILVASSEQNLDEAELNEARYFSHLKQYRSREGLEAYYNEVGERFEERLQVLLGRVPSDPQERKKMLYYELSKVNKVFHKLDQEIAVNLYGSYKAFARHIAQASGGFLGYFSVTPEENELIKLPMMEKQVLEKDDEESAA